MIRPKRAEFLEILRKIVEISGQLDELPDLFKSSSLIKLVADEEEYSSSIRSKLNKTYIERELTGVSRLVLHLSPLAKEDPSFALYISELLYNQGINVIHSYVDEDTILIVKTEDGPRAYEILEREIARSRSTLKTNDLITKRRGANKS